MDLRILIPSRVEIERMPGAKTIYTQGVNIVPMKCGKRDIATGAHDDKIFSLRKAGESWSTIASEIGHDASPDSVEKRGASVLLGDGSGAAELEFLSLRIVEKLQNSTVTSGLKENAAAGKALLQMYRILGEFLVDASWVVEVR